MKDTNGVILGVMCLGMSIYLFYPRAKKANSKLEVYFRVKAVIGGIISLTVGIYLLVNNL